MKHFSITYCPTTSWMRFQQCFAGCTIRRWWGHLLPIAYFFVASSFWWGPERSAEYKELTQQASSALERKMWSEALIALEELKRRYPTDARTRLNLACLYREVKLYPQARENAQWVERHGSRVRKESARRILAWVDAEMYLYEEALKALDRLKEKTPGDRALEASLWIKKGDCAKASALLAGLPAKPQVHFWISWCSYKKGDAQALDEISRYYSSSETLKDPWAALLRWSALALKGEEPDFGVYEGPFSSKNFDDTDKEALKLIKRIKSL